MGRSGRAPHREWRGTFEDVSVNRVSTFCSSLGLGLGKLDSTQSSEISSDAVLDASHRVDSPRAYFVPRSCGHRAGLAAWILLESGRAHFIEFRRFRTVAQLEEKSDLTGIGKLVKNF